MRWTHQHHTLLQSISLSNTFIIKITIGLMTFSAFHLEKKDTKHVYLIKNLTTIKTPPQIKALLNLLKLQRLILIQILQRLILIQIWPLTIHPNHLNKERYLRSQEKERKEIWWKINKMVKTLIIDLKEILLDTLPKNQLNYCWRNTKKRLPKTAKRLV